MSEPRGLERTHVNLVPQASDAVQRSMGRTGMSKTDTINRAIQMYDYLEGLRADGAEILIRQPGSNELMLLAWL